MDIEELRSCRGRGCGGGGGGGDDVGAGRGVRTAGVGLVRRAWSIARGSGKCAGNFTAEGS